MDEQEKTPYDGLALAAAFWLWGSIAWFAPAYLGFGGVAMWVCNIVGGILMAISFGGAGMEIGKLFKSEAFEWWGVGLVFLVPAGLLHFAVWYAELSSTWAAVAKGSALLLDGFGGLFVFYGLAYLFWNGSPVELEEAPSQQEKAERRAEDKRRRRHYLVSAAVFLATIVSTIVKTIFGIG